MAQSMEEAKSFELSDYLSFVLRRGSEDSADRESLEFEVSVQRTLTDEIFFRIHFENPSKVSTGSKLDQLVVEIEDEEFFTRTD